MSSIDSCKNCNAYISPVVLHNYISVFPISTGDINCLQVSFALVLRVTAGKRCPGFQGLTVEAEWNSVQFYAEKRRLRKVMFAFQLMELRVCMGQTAFVVTCILLLFFLIMKNFNRRSSHSRHGSKRRKVAQHAHSRGSHVFTHTFTSIQLQPLCTKRQLSYYRNLD